MRPRKKVLIFTGKEMGAAPLIFAIDTRGMTARAAHTAAEFAEQLAAFAPDGALLILEHSAWLPTLRACASAAHAHGVPVLLAPRVRVEPLDLGPDMLLPVKASVMETLEGLRTIVARRRGPKKDDSLNALAARQHAAEQNARLYA